MPPNKFEVGFATRARQRHRAVRLMQGLPVTPAPVKPPKVDHLADLEGAASRIGMTQMRKAFAQLDRIARPWPMIPPVRLDVDPAFAFKFGMARDFGRWDDKVPFPIMRRGTEVAALKRAALEIQQKIIAPIEPITPTVPLATSSTLISYAKTISMADQWDGARSYRDAGYRMLGSGICSQVFADKDDEDVVIKVGRYDSGERLARSGDVPSDGWLQYVVDFGTHPSPHRPVVHSVELHHKFYVARMERLRPQSDKGTMIWNRHHPGELDGSLGEFGKLLEAQYGDSRFSLDCHPGNFMYRDDTLVVTDPLIGGSHVNG